MAAAVCSEPRLADLKLTNLFEGVINTNILTGQAPSGRSMRSASRATARTTKAGGPPSGYIRPRDTSGR